MLRVLRGKLLLLLLHTSLPLGWMASCCYCCCMLLLLLLLLRLLLLLLLRLLLLLLLLLLPRRRSGVRRRAVGRCRVAASSGAASTGRPCLVEGRGGAEVRARVRV